MPPAPSTSGRIPRRISRDTANSLNELGRIFDKKKIEEQQELAAVFGEEAFRLAHNMKDDGSGRKIAVMRSSAAS